MNVADHISEDALRELLLTKYDSLKLAWSQYRGGKLRRQTLKQLVSEKVVNNLLIWFEDREMYEQCAVLKAIRDDFYGDEVDETIEALEQELGTQASSSGDQ